jgi:hypothetical protein
MSPMLVGRVLHWVSMACCAFLIVSFVLFAHAQISHASNHQASSLNPRITPTTVSPPGAAVVKPKPAPPAPHRKGQPRRFIDAVAGKLESLFTGLVSTNNAWVKQLIPLVLSLIVYGGGIGFLGRWANGRA